jgi:hypothetical protein
MEIFARISLFIIYGLFGFLKLLDLSPASPLVKTLLAKTMPFVGFDTFIIILGLYEVLLGVLFLIPQVRKPTIVLFVIHMFMVFSPLILLPSATWQQNFVPTIEGQYILKNLMLISTVWFLYKRKW